MTFTRGGTKELATTSVTRRLTGTVWLRAAAGPVWLVSFYVAANSAVFYITRNLVGMDAHAYWLTGGRAELYGAAPQTADAFLYSPAFAQFIWPLTQLQWPVFAALWMVLEAATFAWLLAPLGWRWGVPAFCWCVPELAIGNVYAFLAVTALLGMRWPALWAFPILTKVTPGLGPLWFAVRREWRQLAWAVDGTLVVVLISLFITPSAWTEWADFLMSSSAGGGPWLTMRLIAAIGLTIVGARLNKPWLLALAMLVASPVIGGISVLSILAAIPRLRQAPVACPAQSRAPLKPETSP